MLHDASLDIVEEIFDSVALALGESLGSDIGLAYDIGQLRCFQVTKQTNILGKPSPTCVHRKSSICAQSLSFCTHVMSLVVAKQH